MSSASPVSHQYEFYAGMTCDGCKGAITRILNKTEGVTSFDANVENKSLMVTATVGHEVILEKLTKWATAAQKEVRFVKEI